MNAWLITLIFVSEILVLYAVSRISTSLIFYVFKKVTKSTDISFALLTFIFFPGTVLHELSHFFIAAILFLRVREFNLLPVWKDNHIKLGNVVYEKQDLIRGIIVGVAPIWTGIGVLAMIVYYIHGVEMQVVMKILLWYLIFIISSTMFSSQQDLKNVIYILPLLIIFIGIIYVFNLPLPFYLIEKTLPLLTTLNWYLLLPIVVHTILIVTIKTFWRI